MVWLLLFLRTASRTDSHVHYVPEASQAEEDKLTSDTFFLAELSRVF
jgi:hypothetical protein